MAQPHDLYEFSLGELYENFLRRQGIEQKEFAAVLHQVTQGTPQQRPSAETWESWLSRVRTASTVRAQPDPAVIHVMAEQLHCTLSDERRLLRAADLYPSDAEIVQALGRARGYAESLRWPACFVDYRFGVLGWTAAFGRELLPPAFHPEGVVGAAGADLGAHRVPQRANMAREAVEQVLAPSPPPTAATRRLRRAQTRSTGEGTANALPWLARPHLLDYLCAPNGLLAPERLDTTDAGASDGSGVLPLLDDVTRVMILVRAYWQPLSVWSEARASWQRVKEGLWRSYPGFQERWDRASFEWYRQIHGPYDALTDSPLANVVHVTVRGRRLRINLRRLGVEPRIELFEFEDIAAAL